MISNIVLVGSQYDIKVLIFNILLLMTERIIIFREFVLFGKEILKVGWRIYREGIIYRDNI